MADESRLTWALILSVLLHGLLLSLLPVLRRAHIELPTPPALLDVDVLPMPKAPPPPAVAAAPAPPVPPLAVPKQQIVSLPDAGEEKEPANTRLLSDRNNTVKEEMVHRDEPAAGDPDAPAKAPPQQVAAAKAAQPPPAAKTERERSGSRTHAAALPKLDQLLPSAGDLIREGLVKPQESGPTTVPDQHASTRDDLLRHGDPWKRGSLRGGTLDFLPAVREGDITLLNTKAEQFAPFVRRVAMRVLENLRIFLRRSLGGTGSHGAEEFAIVEAIMDRQGHLLSLTTKERSSQGTLDSDRNLQAACHEGCFDRNPPDGAQAADGNIHFLFEVRVALIIDQAGRSYADGIFAAGLL